MGTAIFVRNKYWWYTTMYDDYAARFTRMSYGVIAFLWLPHYWYGVHLNRCYEEYHAHLVYCNEYSNRRMRLAEDLMYEEFDQHLEMWIKFQEEAMTDQAVTQNEQTNQVREQNSSEEEELDE